MPSANNKFLRAILGGEKLALPKEWLASGGFKYLQVETAKETGTTTSFEPRLEMYHHQNVFSTDKNRSSNVKKISQSDNGVVKSVAKAAPTVCSVVSTFADNAVRVVAPAAQLTARTFSIDGIVVSLTLTPVLAAWSFYSADRGMNAELHEICNALVVILQYFTVDRCNEYCQNL